MTPDPTAVARAERLTVRLRVELGAAGYTLAAASQALGYAPGALRAALSSPERLTMSLVFVTLEEIGLHPADFFLRLRPVATEGYLDDWQALNEVVASRPLDIDPAGRWVGPSEVPRMSRELRLAIEKAGKTVRQVSRALGYAPDTFGSILRGRGALKVWQVYAALEAIQIPYEDFFDGLYGLVGGAPDLMLPGGRTWSELRNWVRGLSDPTPERDSGES